MTTPELPALRPFDTYECDGYPEKVYNDDGLYVTVEEVEARERVLLARVAEADEQLEEVRGHLRYLIEYLTATGVLHTERGFTWPDGEQLSVQIYKDLLGDKYKPYFRNLPP